MQMNWQKNVHLNIFNMKHSEIADIFSALYTWVFIKFCNFNTNSRLHHIQRITIFNLNLRSKILEFNFNPEEIITTLWTDVLTTFHFFCLAEKYCNEIYNPIEVRIRYTEVRKKSFWLLHHHIQKSQNSLLPFSRVNLKTGCNSFNNLREIPTAPHSQLHKMCHCHIDNNV